MLNYFEGLDEKTITHYKGVYEGLYVGEIYKSLEAMCEASFQAKKGLRELFNIPDSGFIKLPDSASKQMTPRNILADLIRKTENREYKAAFERVYGNISVDCINCGYIHRNSAEMFLKSKGSVWPDEKNNVLSLAKLVSSTHSEEISQVFSKIYNKQRGTALYLSVNPMHILMLSDHGKTTDGKVDTGNWWSCHNTVEFYCDEHDKHAGNVDYMLDENTMIVFAGNPEYEEYAHYKKKDKVLIGINPSSRTIIHVNSTTLVVSNPYQDNLCAIECGLVGSALTSLMKIKKWDVTYNHRGLNWGNHSRGGVDCYPSGGGYNAYMNGNERIEIGLHKIPKVGEKPAEPKPVEEKVEWVNIPDYTIEKIQKYIEGRVEGAVKLLKRIENKKFTTHAGINRSAIVFGVDSKTGKIIYMTQEGKNVTSDEYDVILPAYSPEKMNEFTFNYKRKEMPRPARRGVGGNPPAAR